MNPLPIGKAVQIDLYVLCLLAEQWALNFEFSVDGGTGNEHVSFDGGTGLPKLSI